MAEALELSAIFPTHTQHTRLRVRLDFTASRLVKVHPNEDGSRHEHPTSLLLFPQCYISSGDLPGGRKSFLVQGLVLTFCSLRSLDLRCAILPLTTCFFHIST